MSSKLCQLSASFVESAEAKACKTYPKAAGAVNVILLRVLILSAKASPRHTLATATDDGRRAVLRDSSCSTEMADLKNVPQTPSVVSLIN